MSEVHLKRTVITLAWTMTVALSLLLVDVSKYHPVIVDGVHATRWTMSQPLASGVIQASDRVVRDQAALTSALAAKGPGKTGDAGAQFGAMFGSMDALDSAWDRVDAESTFVAKAGATVRFPLSPILGAMMVTMMVVAGGVTMLRVREDG